LEQADGEPAPLVIEKNYYLLFAAGLLRTEGIYSVCFFVTKFNSFIFILIEQIAKHSFTFVTSKTYQLQNSEIINLDESIVSLF